LRLLLGTRAVEQAADRVGYCIGERQPGHEGPGNAQAHDSTGKTVYVLICLPTDPGTRPGDGRISRLRTCSAQASRR
jgi:hypothetical protein